MPKRMVIAPSMKKMNDLVLYVSFLIKILSSTHHPLYPLVVI